MKTEFLKELGLEQDAIDKVMAENGKDIDSAKKTLTENVAKVEAERDGLKTQLEAANASLQALDGADPADIKAELEKAKAAQKEAEQKAADLEKQHAADVAKRDSRAETEKLLSSHKFINDITKDHFVSAIEAALEDPANKGKGREELFKALTQDAEGNPKDGIFASQDPPPAYSGRTGSGQLSFTVEQFKKLSYTDRLKIKQTNPELYDKLTKGD